MRKFFKVMTPSCDMRILDVGGLPRFWEGIPIQAHVTMLNLHPLDEYDRSFMTLNQEAVVGDGTSLPYPDKSFDLVFSNSVIEHLGDAERQAAFAYEARRVGRSYWIQTPAKEFVMEPHYFTLFLHWCPKRIQKRFLKNFSLWGLLGRPSEAILDMVLSELRLLAHHEFEALFPDGKLWVERLLGLPKSYTAYKLLGHRSPLIQRGRIQANVLLLVGLWEPFEYLERVVSNIVSLASGVA